MTIRWIGQSGYIITTDSTEIIIDPYLSDIVNKVAKRPRLVPAPINPASINADAVVCSHNHLDHLDTDAIESMRNDLLFITTSEGGAVLAQMGKSNVKTMSVGDTVTVGDISLTAVYAEHTVEAFGLIVRADGITMYFSGDTLYSEELSGISQYNPDIAFICINGKLGNMNVDDAVRVAAQIGATINIPNHYGMFASNTEDPTKFTNRMTDGFIMNFNQEYTVVNSSGIIKLI